MVRREDELAIVESPPGQARHIRRRGSDFEAGDELLGSGRRLDYRALVTAAGADLAEVMVRRRPRLFLLSTGDELVDPGSARANPGTIPESVSFGVSALAELWGAQEIGRARLRDDLPAMERAAAEAVGKADLVVVTGGASVGEKDFARAMFAPLALELIFSKVAIKPGKPVWLGRAGETLVMGLPGNPTSALVTGRLLLAPLVAGLAGLDPTLALRWTRMMLAAPLEAGGDRETFVRARRRGQAAEPIDNQDSSAQRALADADLLLRRRPNAPSCAAGKEVDALDF
jgi:molybdopterin molybdotransferase